MFNSINIISFSDFLNLKEKSLLIFYGSEKDDFTLQTNELINCGLKFPFNFSFSFLLLNYNSINLSDIQKYIIDFNHFSLAIKFLSCNRKIFVLNGNCQTDFLQQYLLSNSEFTNKFFYVHFPRIQSAGADDIKYIEWLLKISDFCYSQIISETNKFCPFLATKNIFKLVKENCVCKTISNITFLGYYPQTTSLQENNLKLLGANYFAYGDTNIDLMIRDGKKCSEIIKEIKKDDFYRPKEVLAWFKEQLEITKKRDSECDIQIFDFLNRFIDKKICFHSFNHPHNFLIKELATRILLSLNIKNILFNNIERLDHSEKLRGESQIIYPSVLKALNLKERFDASYLINRRLIQIDTQFDEWISHYYYSKKISLTPINIDIWGSINLLNLIKKSSHFCLKSRILDNPINSTFSEADQNGIKIITTLKSLTKMNIEKSTEKYFKQNFNSKFIIIDFADIRFDYIENLTKNSRITITKSFLEKVSFDSKVWSINSSLNESDEQIKNNVLSFKKLLLSKYKEENIILLKTYFATKYIGNDFKIYNLTKRNLYSKFNELVRKYENAFLNEMKNVKIIDLEKEPLSTSDTPLSYCKRTFELQQICLCSLFDILYTKKEAHDLCTEENYKFCI